MRMEGVSGTINSPEVEKGGPRPGRERAIHHGFCHLRNSPQSSHPKETRKARTDRLGLPQMSKPHREEAVCKVRAPNAIS